MTDKLLALIVILSLLIAGTWLLRETLRGSLKLAHKECGRRSRTALIVLGLLGVVLVSTACGLGYRYVSAILSRFGQVAS